MSGTTRWNAAVATLALVAGLGCQRGDEPRDTDRVPMDPGEPEPTPTPTTPTPTTPAPTTVAPTTPAPKLMPLTADALHEYARRLAPMLVGRTLTAAEIMKVRGEGEPALKALLEAWVKDARFPDAARTMIALALRASGKQGTTDLDLPGNLAAALAKQGRPWSQIISAEECADSKGAPIPCDTGAPYAAGVLTTRAFLIGNAGRFNLRRARTVMETFACLDYPMAQDVQPSLPKEVLSPMFQADTANEQTVEAARGTFGNGFACYTCHSQFGAHAQLFVKFDEKGMWRQDATGIQDPKGEQGRSTLGLFASHMLKPADAASEASQMFGKKVANMNEAGRVIAASPLFLPCSARMLIGHVFGLPESETEEIPVAVVDAIVGEAKKREADPSLGALAVAAFTHPAVVRSLRAGANVNGGTP